MPSLLKKIISITQYNIHGWMALEAFLSITRYSFCKGVHPINSIISRNYIAVFSI